MYDVIIIGAGVSSVFLTYELSKLRGDLNLLVIDRGSKLEERSCGTDQGNSCTCEGPCSKYMGFAGLGKSEGKFNYTNDFGGELGRKIGEEKALDLMKHVDDILCSFGADQVKTYSTLNESLQLRAERKGLKVLSTEVRHLGTRLAEEVFQKIYECIERKVDFRFNTFVETIIPQSDGFKVITEDNIYETKRVVLATGMSGSEWMTEQLDQLGIHHGETRLDLGLRVEMPGNQLASILQHTFETKLQLEWETYSGTTYCMNPRGRIIRKYQHGLVMPDGQNQHEENSPGSNLNFTFFVPEYFRSQHEAMDFARKIIGSINRGKDRVVVQRLEDLIGVKPTQSLEGNKVVPSLVAQPGNIHDEVPECYIQVLMEFLRRLEDLLEEPIDMDSLIYGIDAKFYEPKLVSDVYFQTEVKGLYVAGDCSGETHSLSQAAASGVYLAQVLSKGNDI
ncbi:NAD(FAD)-utilizing dehydrogenase [Halobacillus yeomjeoni]|uniref:NAD(FAD)-utilizing dehydrogenase n=1 Tax=Halobacillus yeomjeoni TaxID=311194 RepID=A0A931HUB1_9BACI|nr:NAD(FAD)-utilizing dehydrogenase [Halobacillus yeomjeoni]MBH0229689.1 NAD(FAD)-utilizing dehydrogenase [Halobacillus yeomjeoni]